MGAIACHRPKGLSDKEFFENEYPSLELLVTSRKNGVVYAATRRRDKPEEVFALVMAFTLSRSEHNFCWREDDETVGPWASEAPAKVLDLLTPTDHEWASAWRLRCRENLAKAALDKERAARVTEGTVIRTKEPVFFGKPYGHFSEFRFVKGSTFVAYRDGFPAVRVSLSRWKNREYEVVS